MNRAPLTEAQRRVEADHRAAHERLRRRLAETAAEQEALEPVAAARAAVNHRHRLVWLEEFYGSKR